MEVAALLRRRAAQRARQRINNNPGEWARNTLDA
jgi:hypothetical protein